MDLDERERKQLAESFPPHTRGWTGGGQFQTFELSVSPAHAGMDRCSKMALATSMRFPRTRGDGPSLGFIAILSVRFPPHTRGWTVRDILRVANEDVSPAHAGMDPRYRNGHVGQTGFPRTRGMDPLPGSRHFENTCFPRTRGDGPSAVAS